MGKKWAANLPTWDSIGKRANAIIDMKIEMLSVRASWDSLGGWGEYPMDEQEVMEEAIRRTQERKGG